MDYRTMHPTEQIAMIMSRIYARGMTTTSGGNVSCKDEQGRLWVTPTSFDKAELQPQDIVCIMPDGTFVGHNKPTSEYKFHMAAMQANPNFHACVHAHSIALMGYSFLKEAPDIKMFPYLKRHVGEMTVAPYEMPGSRRLSDRVYDAFKQGYSAAILENHGVVVGGVDLLDAYSRFEEIEFCAETLMKAWSMGYTGDVLPVPSAPEDSLAESTMAMPEVDPGVCSPEECQVRALVAKLGRRLYQQKMCLTKGGSFSIRLDNKSFIISQHAVDRKYMQPDDTVKIMGNCRERGKVPDYTVHLHQQIFNDHPDINFIILAEAQNTLAYTMAGKSMHCEVVPEAYLLVRSLPVMECGEWAVNPEKVSAMLNKNVPVIQFKNDRLLVTGKGWFDSYDRVEVADYNAKSMRMAQYIGEMKPLTEEEIIEFSKMTGIL